MKRKVKELKRISRDILNDRYGTPMGAFVAASLIPAVIEIPFSMSANDYPTLPQLIITLLAEFLIMLIAQVLHMGVVRVHLNMTRKLPYRITTIFDPVRFSADRFFGAGLLLSILAVVCFLPAIFGSLYFYYTDTTVQTVLVWIFALLVSTFFYTLLILYFDFAAFLLLDYPQMKVFAAFKESARLMKGNKARLLYLLLSFLGWGIPVLFSLGIASLWISPYMTQTMVSFYLDCTGELDRIPDPAAPQTPVNPSEA